MYHATLWIEGDIGAAWSRSLPTVRDIAVEAGTEALIWGDCHAIYWTEEHWQNEHHLVADAETGAYEILY